MSLILTIDTTTNKVLSQERQTNKKVIVDWFSINDTIVVDEETWDICLYEKSSQWLKRLEELSNKDNLSVYDANELEYLLPKTHIVNVTTKDWERHYVIHEISEWIDFDGDRWDRKFSSKEIAQKFIDTFNS